MFGFENRRRRIKEEDNDDNIMNNEEEERYIHPNPPPSKPITAKWMFGNLDPVFSNNNVIKSEVNFYNNHDIFTVKMYTKDGRRTTFNFSIEGFDVFINLLKESREIIDKPVDEVNVG